MSNNINLDFENNIESIVKLCNSEVQKQFLLKIINYTSNESTKVTPSKIENNYHLSYIFRHINKKLTDELIGIRVDYSGYYDESVSKFIEIYPKYRINSFNKKTYSNMEIILDFAVFLTNIEHNNISKKYNIHFNSSMIKNELIDFEDVFQKKILLDNNFTELKFTTREVRNMNESDIRNVINILFQEKF